MPQIKQIEMKCYREGKVQKFNWVYDLTADRNEYECSVCKIRVSEEYMFNHARDHAQNIRDLVTLLRINQREQEARK